MKRNRGKPADRRRLLLFAVAAAACAGGDAATTDRAPAAAEELVLQATDVAVVERAPLGTGVLLTGTLNPYRTVQVRAQVPGIVSDLRVDRGDAVAEGQLLAVIEAEGIRSAAAGAAAQVVAMEANLTVARQRYESSRKLFERGAISEIELKTAEAAFEAARGQLEAARAQETSASESARRANVTAPIAGEISNRHVNEGEAVSPGDMLVTVVNTSQLELAGNIPVQAAARVRRGQRVEFTVDAYPGRTFEGTVARVEPTADPATRQVGVYLRLPNPNRAIVGGLFATGRVLTGGEDSVLVLPVTAIREEGERTYVWEIAADKLVRRDVVTGARDPASGRVEIVNGIEAGARVLAAPGTVPADAVVRVEAQGTAPAGPRG